MPINRDIATYIYWRIIACESSDYRHIVHDDGFVWLMFVHERFSASEQTLNSQNHGVHYMSVITRLTCNNSILLTRNSPGWQTYRDDTADDTVLCISGIVFRDDEFTLMACMRSQRKHTYVLADTRVITYVIPSVMSSRQGGLARVQHDHWSTWVPKYTDVWVCVTWRELTNHVPLFTLKIWNLITE